MILFTGWTSELKKYKFILYKFYKNSWNRSKEFILLNKCNNL